MKKFYLVLFVLCISTKILSQTTATDFIVNDCDGNSHHLFSELNSGKVVVIAWVMPCPPCATHAISAYSSALNFETSHPNRVKYYLVDDFANTTCSALSSWASSNGLGSTTMFSDAAISMTDYGQIGMPKIVVLGGIVDVHFLLLGFLPSLCIHVLLRPYSFLIAWYARIFDKHSRPQR